MTAPSHSCTALVAGSELARPATASVLVAIALIANAATKTGLTVRCELDSNAYPKGAAFGVVAATALAPLAAVAETDDPSQPIQVAQSSAHAGGGGSFKRHLRYRNNQSRERARVGAEHMRRMRMAPAAPKT